MELFIYERLLDRMVAMVKRMVETRRRAHTQSYSEEHLTSLTPTPSIAYTFRKDVAIATIATAEHMTSDMYASAEPVGESNEQRSSWLR